MIQTGIESKVKIQDIISSQLPEFILDESPKAVDFLKQYYISQEYQGGPVDLSDNLDEYLKVDNLTPEVIVDSTTLSGTITSTDTTIEVSSTKGFPNQYGLLKIDDEIITYTGITPNSFTGCVRGFSGVTDYKQDLNSGELVFSTSTAADHSSGATIQNLSSLFLKEFYKKIKSTFTPGLENISFAESINAGNFIKRAKDFYSSKGTDESIKILFKVIFGETPSIINLEDYLIKPSFANYVRREVAVAEVISGDITKIVGQTLTKSNDENTFASISALEPFTRKGKTFYKIQFYIGNDGNSSAEGNFIITPNTKLIENVSAGDSILTVDSTVSFPESGTLISGSNTITYTGKSISQFFGCTGISADISKTSNIRSSDTYFSYENGDTSKKVELLLLGVIDNIKEQSENFKTSEGDIIQIKNLGDKVKNSNSNWKEIFANSFIYNTSTRHQIIDNNTIKLGSPIDRSSLKIGDEVEILERGSEVVVPGSGLISITNVTPSSNTLQLENNPTLEAGKEYDVRRKVNRINQSGAGFTNNTVLSDVSNVYFEEDEFGYVASNSLPSSTKSGITSFQYNFDIDSNIKSVSIASTTNLKDKVNDRFNIVSLGGTQVPFVTGDQIFYSSQGETLTGLTTGTYFVKKVSNNEFKLYGSISLVESGSNLTFGIPSTSTGDNIGSHKFVLNSQKDSELGIQKLFRKFPLEKNIEQGSGELTVPGTTGMLINGVEISNYKSNDNIYFGPIEDVNILFGGTNYDVINLPIIKVSTGIGTTAKVQPVISGKFEKVYVDSQDYNIDKITSIDVSGGNGSGVVLEPVLVSRSREVLFNANKSSVGGGVNEITNQIAFLTDHNFINGEQIIYNSSGNNAIAIGTAGNNSLMPNNSSYFVEVSNNKAIKLYFNLSDFESKNNPVGIFTGSAGIHKFSTLSTKRQVDSIKVINSGEGYTNRKLIVNPTGISTTEHTVNFNNHGFNSGEIVEYDFETTQISGISTANQFYVLKVDNNAFRLCNAGVGGTIVSNYEQGNYEKFNSAGSGEQYFKYPDISVSIKYVTAGIGSTTQVFENLVTTPVVKGEIIDAYVYQPGTGYGSTVLNYEKKPTVTVENGKLAKLSPVIVAGAINNVTISYEGIEYYSVPDLVVTGSGTGAELRAIINTSGQISEVKVINPGIGYSSTDTKIEVISSGKDAIFDPQIRKLTVDNNQRYSTGELLSIGKDKLQYTVLKYFEGLRNAFLEDGTLSGIIGWAYDGNPIYGPTGYPDPENVSSGLKTLQSGYTLDISNVPNRPSGFSDGFFVEDYKFDESGDLDEYNGRYERNDEYPNGVYAYHATIDEFPYFIGNKYRSKLISDSSLDQSFDFNNSNLLRNTLPYKVSEKNADYDFINETSDVLDQKIEILSVNSGAVESVKIQNGGNDFKVGDKLIFDETGTSGSGLNVEVKSIKGRDITNIVTNTTTNLNSIFSWESPKKVKISILPNHNLSNLDFVTISGFSTELTSLNGTHQITVPSYTVGRCLSTITSVASVGLTTEIYVAPVPDEVSIGSSISVGTETLKILDIYRNENILRVKRGLAGVSHSEGTSVSFLPDSFTISKSVDKFESAVNNTIFFNPHESVGVGTTSGVGYSTSFDFGDISVVRDIPTKSLHIENHPFKTNQSVIYTANGTTLSISTDGQTQSNIPSNLFVVNKNPNLIGLKTSINGKELFFHTNGVDNDEYSLRSNFTQITGDIEKNVATVSVSTSHGLQNGDSITLEVKPNLSVGIGTSTAISVIYNSKIGNIVINPIGFNSTGINSTTNEITIIDHQLKTGDKVFYGNGPLSEDEYYIYRVNKNKIKLCETFFDSQQIPPSVVGFASTGGSNQNLALINPRLNVIENNNLVFDLSDTSLVNYNLKLYTDSQFKNEFVSTGSTTSFSLSGVGTVGLGTTATLTLEYSSTIPKELYYNLEKDGVVVNPDTDVQKNSSIRYNASVYNNTYSISGVGTTTFNLNIDKKPERSSYISTECDTLEYSTTSISTTGSVKSLNVLSFGSEYKKIPTLKSTNSVSGSDLIVNVESTAIGSIKQKRILNNRFTYSSDKTLRPKAKVSPNIVLKNSNTIDTLTILNGGSGYIDTPTLTIVDSTTRNIVNSGLLKPILTGSSISSVDIEVSPKGLSDDGVEIFTTNNTNGVAVVNVESSNTGIFTCSIPTPSTGSFSVLPFVENDLVYVEGIQKLSNSIGDGFNSEDYGFKLFRVSNVDTSGLNVKVTLNISGLTTNTGIAKTVQDFSGVLINENDYPSFKLTQKQSTFLVGETLSSNNQNIDLTVVENEENRLKVSGLYELSLGEIITGTESGSIATIEKLTNNEAIFNVNYSNLQDIGWDNETGKLSEDYQVTANNDYYQNLSYSVKSSVTYKDQQSPVENLVHTSGLKNFADTQISKSVNAGLAKSSDGFTIVYDVIDQKRVDTINNFDNVIDSEVVDEKSKFLRFQNKRLTNYTDLKNLNVLDIDNISNQFSNFEDENTEFLSIQEVDDISYHNYLFRVVSTDGSEVQLTDLTILSDGKETVIVENESLQNSNSAYGTFDLVENEFDETFLRFNPVDAFNTDYDIKLIKQVFNSNITGVGTTAVGFVDLTGSVTTSAGIGTTAIISLDSSNFESLYVNTQIRNTSNDDMNYVRLYIAHDGTNTYMSEYYIDNNLSSSTGDQIGFFTCTDLGGGVLSLVHENTSSDSLNIRTNVVGFGTTTSGIGTFRFKSSDQLDGQERSAIYESNFQSMVGIASTTIHTLDKTLFNASKSVVQVSIGSSKALHQVMMIFDGTDIYTQQLPFLSVDTTVNTLDTLSGIGTFGGEVSGSNLVLKFYPDDQTQQTDIEIFSKSLYTGTDVLNDYLDLTYGSSTESIDEKFYNSINGDRINRKNFKLTTNNTPIFSKQFNPNSVSLAATTGIFTIEDHFFYTGEELIYTPNSTIVGVGTSAMMTSATDVLPSSVYAIKLTENTFKVATSTSNAISGIGTTFASLGEGNAHRFTMKKKNSKCIITVDELVQYPVAYTGIAHSLSGNIGGTLGVSTTFVSLSGISTINIKDILYVDEEFMGIVNVGLGTTNLGPITNSGNINLVEVDRGFVGSSATSHSDNTEARIYKGAFNIVDDEINFAEAPRGNPQIDKTRLNLDFETSSFTGRTFLKSIVDDSGNLQDINKVYDNISDQFTGIGRTFTLTVGGANTTGIGTTGGSGLIFINSIYQSPKTANNPTIFNYEINENTSSGITTVEFSGITKPDIDPVEFVTSDTDVNQNETPRGGIIVSLGSTPGLGFAPLVGASVTAVVGAGGSFVSVGLGTTDNLGSGYNGLVSIGVTVVDIEYDHRFVSAGVNSITDNTGGTHTATDATYNSRTGDLVLTILNHGLTTSNTIGIATESLTFTCSKDSHATNHPYPRAISKTKLRRGQSGGDPIHNQQVAIAATTLNTIQIGVGSGGGAGTGAVVSVDSIGIGGTLSFNVGSAGTNYVNPEVFVDNPAYKNLPVTGVSRLGVGATTDTGIGLLVDVKVGGSSTTVGIGSTHFEVSEFQISRSGYAFQKGDVFKPVGLVTDSRLSSPISNFELTVLETYSDSFAAWEFGELDYIDSIKELQDGNKTRFPLQYNGELLSFEADNNEPIKDNMNNLLVIFINGVLQKPVTNYVFEGGTSFVFTKAPLFEDEVEIYYYKGLKGTDSQQNDNVKPTIEPGDIVQVKSNNTISNTVTQENRTVYDLTESDRIETNRYDRIGVDDQNQKPVSWTKQKAGKKINGEFISKTRDSIEPLIFPTARIIKDVSTTDTEVFIENSKLFSFETDDGGYNDLSTPCDGLIVENTNPITATFTCSIDGNGSVVGISTSNPGFGYLSDQTTIALKFVGIATTTATATASVTNGVVTGTTITNPGVGYTVEPTIFAETPNLNIEKITGFNAINGASGIVTGITTSAGTASNPLAIVFTIIDTGATLSGLSTGYPIYINETNVGNGVTSIDTTGLNSNTVGIGTTCLDNIYYVGDWSSKQLSGSTHVGLITCNVDSNTNIVGIATTGSNPNNIVGRYSWGRLSSGTRSSNPVSIAVTGNVVSGLATYPTIQRRGVGIRKTGALPKIES